jgi:cell division protein FtsI/penicillin-binding protein 2
LIIALIFCLGGETYQILDIAVFKREYYQRFVDLAQATMTKKSALRGRILNRNGEILAIITETVSAEKIT